MPVRSHSRKNAAGGYHILLQTLVQIWLQYPAGLEVFGQWYSAVIGLENFLLRMPKIGEGGMETGIRID